MAAGESQEEKNSGEGPPGEDEEGGAEKMSKDSVEMAGADATEEKEVAGVGGREEGKSRRGRKRRGGPGRPKGESAGKKAGRKRPLSEAKPAVERPTRERKTVERFSITSPQRAVAPKAVSIQQGPGTKLKDIPNVFFKLSKRRADENLKLLHTILFAKKAKVLYLKRNICQFSGFVWTENAEKQKAKVKEKLDKCVKDKLLDFCDILDIPVAKVTTKKEEISAKLLEFLEAPHVTRDIVLAEKEQKGRKRKRRTKGTNEATSGDADSERETKTFDGQKQKRSNVPSAVKRRHKKSAKIMEEDEEEGGSADGIDVASALNEDEGGAEGSDDEKNETAHERDEHEPVVDKKVSTQKQGSKDSESNVNVQTTVIKGSPAKSAKSSSGSSSKKSPSEGKLRVPGKSSTGSSMEQSKKRSKASTKQEAEPTKKGSVKYNKSTSNSGTSPQEVKHDSEPYDAFKPKGDKSKSKKNDSLTEDKDKKKSQPGLAVSANKKGLSPQLQEGQKKVKYFILNSGVIVAMVDFLFDVSTQGKERPSGKSEPTGEEMHAVVCDILKEVDFNTATLADILRQLGSQFGMDLMHRKAEVKSIIEEVINDMTDDEEDGEDEDDAEEAQKGGDA